MAATPINQKQPGDSGYVYFFHGKEIGVYAPNAYEAKRRAIAHFKPSKKNLGMVHGMIAEDKDGKPVIHSTASI